jgi:microcin C transport system permease protein
MVQNLMAFLLFFYLFFIAFQRWFLLLYSFLCFVVLPHGALFPLGGLHSDGYETFTSYEKLKDLVHHLFLPVLASLFNNFTILTFLQKNSMLEVIGSDYIRTARAKGLSEKVVILKHALRNALLPLMVGFGALLGTFLGGSIIIEQIFGLPGLGVLSLEALSSKDFNVIMAIVVLQSAAVLFGQLLSDIAYVFVDPRIEYK